MLPTAVTVPVWLVAHKSASASEPIDQSGSGNRVLVAAAVDPMQFDIAPEGRIFFIERSGIIKLGRPDSDGAGSVASVEIRRLEVGLFGEVDFIGFALSADFGEILRLLVMYCTSTAHHPQAFTMWLAGGGVEGRVSLKRTDALGFNVVEDAVHVHDLQAPILQLLGLDHRRLTYHYPGRNFRPTDVHGQLVQSLLA